MQGTPIDVERLTFFQPVPAEIARSGYWPTDAGEWVGNRNVYGKTALYRRALDIFTDIRSTYALKGGETEKQIIEKLAACGLLVIDEFQEQGRSEFDNRIITNLIDRNVTPDKALTGQWGATDEKFFAMQRLGSLISSQDPTAKVQEFKPQIPQDLWAIIDKIDAMFDETISLNNLSKGHGDTGVRSKGQTESLLRVGSSRPKKRALTIEDSLERIATLYLKLDQKHNDEPLDFDEPQKGVNGNPVTVFISEQFTKDYMAKVDGHSSSPVFVEDQKNDAKWMFENQIIDGESYLDIAQPMNVQILKEKYKVMAKNKAAAAQKEEAMAEAESQGKLAKLKQG